MTVDIAENDKEISFKRANRDSVQKRRLFYEKLCTIDFERIQCGLNPEHLYQEAIETKVADILMKEKEVNSGNNILDCY